MYCSSRRRLARAASVPLLLSGLVACSAEPSHKNEADVVHVWTSAAESGAVRVLAGHFAKAGGTWVDDAIAGGPPSRTATISRTLAGDPPSAGLFHAAPEFMDLATNGLIENVDTLAAREHWDRVMAPLALDAVKTEGHYYAVPLSVSSIDWLWYNTAVLKKLGVKEPQNWDDAIALFKKAKAAGLVPLAFSGSKTYERGLFNAVLAGDGGVDLWRGIYERHDPKSALTPRFLAVARRFKSLQDYIDPGAPGRSWNQATDMVISGKAAGQVLGDWVKGEFVAAGKKPGRDFGCAPLHSDVGGSVFRTEVFIFPKQLSTHKTQAQALLSGVLSDPTTQADFALAKGMIPARLDIDESRFDSCTQKAIALLRTPARTLPSVDALASPAMLGELDDAISAFWNTPGMSAEAFAQKVSVILTHRAES